MIYVLWAVPETLSIDHVSLSRRETTVLHLVAWGYTNKDIAECLGLSVKTVEAHKGNGMRKLGARNRADIVRYALQKGWLGLDAAPQLPGSSRNGIEQVRGLEKVPAVPRTT